MPSSTKSSSSDLSDVKTLSGFLGNLTDFQEYQLKQAYLVLYQAAKITPTSTKVGLTVKGDEKPAAKTSKFSFRAQPAQTQEETSIESCLDAFQKAIHDMSPEEIIDAFHTTCRNDHPDSLLLRFLRARKWELAKTMDQVGVTLHWRTREWNIDTLLERGEEYYIDVEPDEGFINQYKEGKVTLHGHDKQGRPLVFIHVAKHDPRAQSNEAMERYTLQVIELARLCLTNDVNTAAVVFDLSGFGLGNMDYHVVKFILTCFERFYPECLGYLFIHRAPWVFSSVWSIIKGWIDPVVASKISFTKSEKDLLKFIDSDQIPKELGGTSDFEYRWIPPQKGESSPILDTEEREKKVKERDQLFSDFEKLTLDWIKASDPKSCQEASIARNKAFENIYEQYWRLDPYIRARTIADRNGTLGEFKPQLAKGGVSQPTL